MRTRNLLTAYVLAAFLFLLFVASKQRDYADTWVLQDVLLPTLLFVFVYSAVIVNVEDNRIVALLSASFAAILASIAQLKYVFIYGAFDPVGHYGFTNRLILTGHAPQVGFYADEYSAVPGTHIFLGSLSMISGLSLVDTIKLFLPIVSVMVVLIVYIASKRILSPNKQKFVLIASSFSLPIMYTLRGSVLGILFFAAIIYFLFSRAFSSENKRAFSAMIILFIFGLIVTHGFTTIFLAVLLTSSIILFRIFSFRSKVTYDLVRTNLVMPTVLLTVSFLTWWAYEARFYLYDFLVNSLQLLRVQTTVSTVSGQFFKITLFDQIEILVVRFSGYVVIGLAGLVGFVALFRFYRTRQYRIGQVIAAKHVYYILFLFLVIMIFLVVPYVRKFQSYTLEERYVVYALALSPFFVGMGLWGVHEFLSRRLSRFSSKGKLISKVLYVSVVFLLISASLVQVFPCQPLVPQVEGLYVVDYRGGNSIYQRDMIAFFGEHFPSDVKVSSDGMTSWQLLGLTNASFNFDYLYQQNPLVENESLATVVLLHYGGRSGRLNEPIEYRTLEHVTEVRSGFGNSVYDNGESFVIVRATHP